MAPATPIPPWLLPTTPGKVLLTGTSGLTTPEVFSIAACPWIPTPWKAVVIVGPGGGGTVPVPSHTLVCWPNCAALDGIPVAAACKSVFLVGSVTVCTCSVLIYMAILVTFCDGAISGCTALNSRRTISSYITIINHMTVSPIYHWVGC